MMWMIALSMLIYLFIMAVSFVERLTTWCRAFHFLRRAGAVCRKFACRGVEEVSDFCPCFLTSESAMLLSAAWDDEMWAVVVGGVTGMSCS